MRAPLGAGIWRRAAAAVGAVALVGGGALWVGAQRSSRQVALAQDRETPATATSPAQSVDVITAGRSQTPRWLEVTGTVQAELDAPVGTKVSGRVVSVLARQGDHVRRGQPLLQLDARDLDAGIAQASANLRAAAVGYDNSRTAATMEAALSRSRIAEAQAQVAQSQAGLKAALARSALVQSGPRKQERAQASLAVAQARANMDLAASNLKRMQSLVSDGAISQQQYDITRTQYDVARAQYDAAVQGQSMTDEGSRAEDIRSAQEGVRQAQGAVEQANAGLRQAQAAALQASVKRQEVKGAQAQVGQMQAAVRIAEVTRDYATIVAPFDGVVTQRLVDPGAMAAPGVPLMRLQGGALRLQAVVPESALPWVRQGTGVPVALDALGGRQVAGRAVEIAPQGDTASHTFVVKVQLPAGSAARSGMFGRARIATGVDERMLVPASAVTERQGMRYVYVVDEASTARLRLVTAGDPVGAQVPVLSGLAVGERVVVSNEGRLTDGARVEAR